MALIVDWLFPLLFLAGAGAITWHHNLLRDQAPRTVSAISAGVGLAALLIAFLLAIVPGESYYLGLKVAPVLVGMWILLPLLGFTLLPGLARPTLGTPLRYLELRYELPVARLARAWLLTGRLLMVTFAFVALGRAVASSFDYAVPTPLVIILIGALTAFAAALAGDRGFLWLAVLGGFFFLVSGVASQGCLQAWLTVREPIFPVAEQLDRAWLIDPKLATSYIGNFWILFPAALLGLFSFLLIDDTPFLAWRDMPPTERVPATLVTCFIGLTAFIAASALLGMGLLARYHHHPAEVRPQWVANVDPLTRTSLSEPATRRRTLLDPQSGRERRSLITGEPLLDPTDGVPLLDWNRSEHTVSMSNLSRLMNEQRLWHPHRHEPFTQAVEVTNEAGDKIDPTKLASFAWAEPGKRGEIVLHRRATEELAWWWLVERGAGGFRGIIIAAPWAAMCIVLAWGLQPWLGSRESGLRAARDGVRMALVGWCITLVAAALSMLLNYPSEWLIYSFAATFVPIAAILFVGLLNRGADATSASIALIGGTLWTMLLIIALAIFGKRADAGVWRMHPLTTITISFLATSVIGHIAAMMNTRRRPRGALAGLVLGSTPLGVIPTAASTENVFPDRNDVDPVEIG